MTTKNKIPRISRLITEYYDYCKDNGLLKADPWSRVFRDLRERGLKGVLLVVSDDHEGLRSAQDEILSRSPVAKGEEFHFLHNLLDLVPKKRRKEITAEIRSIFDSPDL